MKRPLLSVFIVASLMVAIAHCFPFPAIPEDSSEEQPFFGVQEKPFWRLPSFTRGDDLFGGEWASPGVDDFLRSLDSIISSFKDQISGFLSNVPIAERPNIEGVGPGGNTTSTSTVIDGHVVTRNETVYSGGNNDTSYTYRVITFDVKPSDDGTEETEDVGGGEKIDDAVAEPAQTTSAPRSVETVEDQSGNEIPKSTSDNFNA